jgi:hypothetical protein
MMGAVAGLPSGWVDVTAGLGGSVDITDALESVLNDPPPTGLPRNEANWVEGDDVTDHGYVVYLPSAPSKQAWEVTRRIDIPAEANVRLLGDTLWSTRLRYTGAGDHMLHSRGRIGRRRAHVLENLILHRGGLLIEGESRFFTDVLNCVFVGTPGFGVETGGPGVVGVRVLNCEFARTTGGVGVRHRGCDNWIIGDNTRFVRLAGVGVACHSSGVHLRDCRFETKQAGAGYLPHVLITGDPKPLPPSVDPFTGGLSEITGCRFGRETPPGTDGPPAVAIEVQPVQADAVLGLLISRNWFNGRNHGPNQKSARNAIAVHHPADDKIPLGRLRNCVVSGNYFGLHHGPLIHEDHPAGPNETPSNFFVANAVTAPPGPIDIARIHNGDGHGWIIDNPLAPPP